MFLVAACGCEDVMQYVSTSQQPNNINLLNRFEDMTKIDPIIFQPFGAGPRNCIGMRFALMEIKMAICKTLQNFQLDVADDTPVS